MLGLFAFLASLAPNMLHIHIVCAIQTGDSLETRRVALYCFHRYFSVVLIRYVYSDSDINNILSILLLEHMYSFAADAAPLPVYYDKLVLLIEVHFRLEYFMSWRHDEKVHRQCILARSSIQDCKSEIYLLIIFRLDRASYSGR